MTNKKIVFLSRPNPFKKEHQLFIDNLKEFLKKYGIETITLQAANYDLSESMEYLSKMIKRCYGIIVVGFAQYFIEKGTKKKGAEKNDGFFESREEIVDMKSITSPFCQIEGTIGLVNNLPMLVMLEKDTRSEGVLAGGRFCTKTDEFILSEQSNFFLSKSIEEQILVWIGEVNRLYLFLESKKV